MLDLKFRVVRSFRRAPRHFCQLLLPLAAVLALPGAVPAAPVSLGGGFRIISVRPGTKPAPPSLVQSQSDSPVPPPSDTIIATPPLEGPVMTVPFTITDQRQEELDFFATAHAGLSGELLQGHTTNVIFGLLDSGSSTHLVGYPDAVASGLQGDYLTGNTYSASGVDGTVDLDVSQPVGFFVQGLQDLDAQGNPQFPAMAGQGNFSCMVNTELNLEEGIDIPTLIGAPFMFFYPAYIRNSQPVPSPILANMSSPSITFYTNAADPAIPVLAHKIFLEVRPTGASAVAYFFLLDAKPYAPSTIIGASLPSALYFTASAMTLHDGAFMSSGKVVVDTGSQATLLSEIAAAELNLDLLNPDFHVDVQGLVSVLTAPGFYIDSATIPAGGGAVSWTNIPVIVLNVASPEGGTLYGIFGSNLTATRDLVFNGAASTPYLGITDPIVPPRMKITGFRRTGLTTAEVDWHSEPAPAVLHLETCTNIAAHPSTWSPIATNAPGTINGTFSVTGLVPGQFFRLQATK